MEEPQVTPSPFDPFMVGPWMEAVRRSWELWFELTFPFAAPPRTPAAPAAVPAIPAAPPVAIAPPLAPVAIAPPLAPVATAPAPALPVLPTAADVAPPIGRPDGLDGWIDHLIAVRRQGLAESGRYVIPKALLAEAAAATGEAETRLIRLVNGRDPDHEGAALDPESHRALEDRVLRAAVEEISAHRQRTGRTEIPPEVLAATAAELRRSPASTRRLLLQRLYGDAPSTASTASTASTPSAPARPASPPAAPKTAAGRTTSDRPSRRTTTRRRARSATIDGQPARRKAAGSVAKDRDAMSKEFKELVNMTPAKLERWLDKDASKSAGQRRGGKGESTGHASGRRIVEIGRKRKADLTDDDFAHMRKTIGYIKRHLAQRPDGDVADTRWRHSLMNWGHDPLAEA